MKSKTLLLGLLLAILCGCDSKGGSAGIGSGDDPVVDGGDTLEPIWACDSEYAIDWVTICGGRLGPEGRERLYQALEKWGSNGIWSAELLETRSFQERFDLSAIEKKCLKSHLCKEFK